MTELESLQTLWRDGDADSGDALAVDVLVQGAVRQRRHERRRTAFAAAASVAVVAFCAVLVVDGAGALRLLGLTGLGCAAAFGVAVARQRRHTSWADDAQTAVRARLRLLVVAQRLLLALLGVQLASLPVAAMSSLPTATMAGTAASLALSLLLLLWLRPRRALLTRQLAQLGAQPGAVDVTDADDDADDDNDTAARAVATSAAMARLRTNRTEHQPLPPEARRRWRRLLVLVAGVAVPLIFDGIVVCCLQAVPRSTERIGEFVPTLTAVVLPLLPLAVAVLSALLTPIGFLLVAPRTHGAFASRSSALALALLLVPQAVAQLGLAGVDWEVFNAHLWSYSTSSTDMAQVVSSLERQAQAQVGPSLWWLAFSREAPGFALISVASALFWWCRFGALIVVVTGVDRVRRSVGLARVAPLLLLQALVWALASFMEHPDFVRGLVDVAVGVTVLLAASLSEQAFEPEA